MWFKTYVCDVLLLMFLTSLGKLHMGKMGEMHLKWTHAFVTMLRNVIKVNNGIIHGQWHDPNRHQPVQRALHSQNQELHP
jgi:hypothetical protein